MTTNAKRKHDYYVFCDQLTMNSFLLLTLSRQS